VNCLGDCAAAAATVNNIQVPVKSVSLNSLFVNSIAALKARDENISLEHNAEYDRSVIPRLKN
jgi:hypothetical protein